MTLEQAVNKWLKDFSSIPTMLVQRAYADDPDSLILLTSEYPDLGWPSGWGWMYSPDDACDERWIESNIDKVERCGFLVYQSEEFDILLGICGCGYDFIQEHWLPLYKIRGMNWHLQ